MLRRGRKARLPEPVQRLDHCAVAYGRELAREVRAIHLYSEAERVERVSYSCPDDAVPIMAARELREAKAELRSAELARKAARKDLSVAAAMAAVS